MKTKDYQLLDGRTIRAKYDRLGMCKISQENIESFVQEFNASYRQAKILEKIKENYALMKLDERKKGKWIINEERDTICCPFCNDKQKISKDEVKLLKTAFAKFNFCTYCGAKILDKIRAEIIKKHLSIVEKNDFDSGRTYNCEEVLDIIDKYKTEIENKK